MIIITYWTHASGALPCSPGSLARCSYLDELALAYSQPQPAHDRSPSCRVGTLQSCPEQSPHPAAAMPVSVFRMNLFNETYFVQDSSLLGQLIHTAIRSQLGVSIGSTEKVGFFIGETCLVTPSPFPDRFDVGPITELLKGSATRLRRPSLLRSQHFLAPFQPGCPFLFIE